MEKMHKYYNSEKDSKLIFSIKLCEFLLSKGHKMIEFKEHKQAKRLIFVFENNNQLHYDIDAYTALKAK